MAIVLETLDAEGTLLLRTPLVSGVTLVQAQPGLTYRVVNDFGGRVAPSALVRRLDDDLRIEDLPGERNLALQGFFSRCTPEATCTLALENIGGTAAETVTPATPPVTALADGGLLMYSAGAPAASVAAAAESGFALKPVAGVAGGLAIVAGAGGGGGGGGSADVTPPAAPTLTSNPLTRLALPAFTGTAESGAKVTLTLFAASPITYETTAQADGAWRIDTASDTPRVGTFVTLPEGVPLPLSVVATDAAGNASAPSSGSVTFTPGPPGAAPTIGVIATDDAVNALEAAAPVTVGGVLPEANRPLTVSWGSTTVAATVNGSAWSAVFAPAQLPADGTTRVRATWLSADGMTSQEATRDVLVDRVAPLAPSIVAVPENAGGGISSVEAADGTQVRIALAGTGAAAGDRLVLTWGTTVVAVHAIAAADAGAGMASIDIAAATLAALPDGTRDLVARVDDVAGNVGATSAAFALTLDRSAPRTTARITAVTDDAPLVTGTVASGGLTNDTTPTLTGTVSAALGSDETVEVLRNGQAVGFAAVSGTRWSFGDSGLSDATTYAYTVRVVDAAGNRGTASTSYSIVVDTAPPSRSLVKADVVDNVIPDRGSVPNGGSTNDTRPELVLTLDSVLASGESLRVHRASGGGSPVTIGLATRDSGTTYVLTEDRALARGGTYTYSADVVDAAGNPASLGLNYTIYIV